MEERVRERERQVGVVGVGRSAIGSLSHRNVVVLEVCTSGDVSAILQLAVNGGHLRLTESFIAGHDLYRKRVEKEPNCEQTSDNWQCIVLAQGYEQQVRR